MKLDQALTPWLPFLRVYTSFAYPNQIADLTLDDFQTRCATIAPELSIENTTVYFSEFIASGTNLSLPENNATCGQSFQFVSVDLCRISLYVATSNRSGIHLDTWLPAKWTGRFASVGNGGLQGCIGYNDLAYTSSLGFASVGANNGHNGTSGGAFYNNADAVADFAYRSVHTGAIVGKQISKVFYKEAHTKSYYLGCSTGGRQGFKSAQDFPDDFDGIVAGAPAFAFNNLTSWSGHFYNLTGPANSSTFLSPDLWAVVHSDILTRCDGLDNYADGILEDPSQCNYTSKDLLCSKSDRSSSTCLSQAQSATVDAVFAPLYASDGSLVYPRMQPGSELAARFILYNGQPFSYTIDWFRYAIYNDPSWDATKINSKDYENAAQINPSNIETWKGDLSAVRDRGTKILHYHGLMDPIISSDNSPRYYEHVSETMGLNNTELDEFYRFFRISGMGHCSGGDGASIIGQNVNSFDSVDPERNVLMAVVNWVENGVGPETIIGAKWLNGTKSAGIEYERAHCKWPKRNVFKGVGDPKATASWECVDA